MPDYRHKTSGAVLREDAYNNRLSGGTVVATDYEPVVTEAEAVAEVAAEAAAAAPPAAEVQYRHTSGFVTSASNLADKVADGTWSRADFTEIAAEVSAPTPELPQELVDKLEVSKSEHLAPVEVESALAGEGLTEDEVEEATVASGATERDWSSKDKPRKRR